MATLARQWMEEGIEKGIEQGLRSSIHTGLKTRFGLEGEHFMAEIAQVQDPAKFQQIVGALFEAGTLAEFRNRCQLLLTSDTAATGAHLN